MAQGFNSTCWFARAPVFNAPGHFLFKASYADRLAAQHERKVNPPNGVCSLCLPFC
jgi:hypothetical protein